MANPPAQTIEAVEGDRGRIYVTTACRAHNVTTATGF